jgi:hypothetical protein
MKLDDIEKMVEHLGQLCFRKLDPLCGGPMFKHVRCFSAARRSL